MILDSKVPMKEVSAKSLSGFVDPKDIQLAKHRFIRVTGNLTKIRSWRCPAKKLSLARDTL